MIDLDDEALTLAAEELGTTTEKDTVSAHAFGVGAERAREVQIGMAARGHHRAAGVVGRLTAAVAEYHGAVVLHHDADFGHIATTTGQPHVRVVLWASVP